MELDSALDERRESHPERASDGKLELAPLRELSSESESIRSPVSQVETDLSAGSGSVPIDGSESLNEESKDEAPPQ